MPAPERLIDLEFPIAGVSLLQEVQEQPPGTTIVGVNVRATNPDGLRSRGGTRAGLSRYCSNQVPSGAGLIQHLNVIVDPTTERLPQNFTVPDETWVEDPLNPGHYVPPGGWGVQPNPNVTPPANPSLTLDFEQSFVDGTNLVTTEQTFSYSTQPGGGRISFVWVVTHDVASGATVTVTNASGDAYTQVGAYVRRTHTLSGNQFSLSLWRRTLTSAAGEIDVKVLPSQEVTLCVAGLEWSGQNATPLGDTNSATGNTNPMSAGAVTVDDGTEAVMMACCGILAPDTVTPSAGFILEVDHNDGSVDNSDIQLFVIYRKTVPAGAVTPTCTYAGGADDFAAMVVEIKD